MPAMPFCANEEGKQMDFSLIIIVLCIFMSAYFSATETAFTSLNRIRVKNMAERGNKKAKLVLEMSEKYDSLLSTILIGNNIVNILCSSLATLLFIHWVGEEAGPSTSTAATTIVILICGEVTPKTIAKEIPEKFAMFSAPVLRVLMTVFAPFNFLFKQWKKLLSKMVKSDNSPTITEEELLTIVEEVTQEGGIDAQESDLIRSAMEFNDRVAEDILTPRIDITAVSTEATKEEIAEIFAESGYSRLPIYDDSVDNIIGILYQKDFHNQVTYKGASIESIIRPVLFTTPTKKIGDLLQELQQKKSHIAVVLDEYGGTVGIVTLEDILEELVGEIWDEHDEVIREIEKMSDKEYKVAGSANLEEVFEILEIDEELDVFTVSGWVMEILGCIPEAGATFTYHHLEVTVLEMDEKRVEKIHIIVNDKEDEEQP